MQIQNIEFAKIKPYANNPRKNTNAIEKVANSIKQFGFKVPVVLDKNFEIVAGHTRYSAAQSLGLTEIPCIIADDLTPEQIKAFRLADNKTHEFSGWDWELLESELADIANSADFDIDMSEFGFDAQIHDVEFDDIPDISNENYIEPESKKCRCPNCGHEDEAVKFKL